jgi:Kef-type K+ transport system membrane component KefB
MVGGAAVAVAFGFPLYWEGIFIGTILTATSVSISAQTLIELGALRSREGATILGAAVIDDVMGIVILSLVVAFARTAADGVDLGQISVVVVRIAAFFAIAVATGRVLGPLLGWTSCQSGGAVGGDCRGVRLFVGGRIPWRHRRNHRRLRRRGADRPD